MTSAMTGKTMTNTNMTNPNKANKAKKAGRNARNEDGAMRHGQGSLALVFGQID